MESSRKAVSRIPASSQAPAPSQLPHWDVPSTPRRQHRPPATQSPSPHRQKRLAQGSSKAQQVLLPGFVNDFAMPPPAKKAKGMAWAQASSQGMRERDMDPPPLQRTQINEHMEFDRHYDDGQVGIADHPEDDLRVDLGDDLRALPPQHLADSSRTAKPFDWLDWVGFFLPLSTLFLALRSLIDETTGPCAFDVANCPKYNPTPAHPTTFRCEARDNLHLGLHVPDGRHSRERGQLRSHCTRRCRFTGSNSK